MRQVAAAGRPRGSSRGLCPPWLVGLQETVGRWDRVPSGQFLAVTLRFALPGHQAKSLLFFGQWLSVSEHKSRAEAGKVALRGPCVRLRQAGPVGEASCAFNPSSASRALSPCCPVGGAACPLRQVRGSFKQGR